MHLVYKQMETNHLREISYKLLVFISNDFLMKKKEEPRHDVTYTLVFLLFELSSSTYIPSI